MHCKNTVPCNSSLQASLKTENPSRFLHGYLIPMGASYFFRAPFEPTGAEASRISSRQTLCWTVLRNGVISQALEVSKMSDYFGNM